VTALSNTAELLMRILHIAYQQIKRFGKTRVNWAQKLSYGLIKNDHFILDFSDRDIASFYGPLKIRDLGKKKANSLLLETVENFKPDLIIAGHCDIITNETLAIAKRMSGAVLVHCNLDPLFVPSNVERIRYRAEVSDAVFVSTGDTELKQFEDTGKRFYFMPNPVDASIETRNNSAIAGADLPTDLVFCSNSNELTRRLEIVGYLKNHLDPQVNFKTYGSFGEPPVWGIDYDNALWQSKMALNLNRQEGDYWYSSERMAQLGGNGLLVFTHRSGGFSDLFPDESLVYFDREEDLKEQVERFNQDDHMRQAWAANTRAFLHNEMNTQKFAQFIVEASVEQGYSHPYVWVKN
jgi:hypothetical protein